MDTKCRSMDAAMTTKLLPRVTGWKNALVLKHLKKGELPWEHYSGPYYQAQAGYTES